MSEVKSNVSAVEGYVSNIAGAIEKMDSDSVVIAEDAVTSLAVNNNSTTLNQSIKEAINLLSARIRVDCERISSIASAFEEKDQAMAVELAQ